MAYATVDFDPDDYADMVSDHEIINEFMDRYRIDGDFRQKVKKYNVDWSEETVEDPSLATAKMYFNQKNYSEMMIYLERALQWGGLETLKVEK